MSNIVDIYSSLNAREIRNQTDMAVAKPQLAHLVSVIKTCGWQSNVLNPDTPVPSAAEGLQPKI